MIFAIRHSESGIRYLPCVGIRAEKQLPSWVFWLACLSPFVGWWLTSLTDVDEGFYAAIAAEMMWRNDYIVPHLNHLVWIEKPILVYWIATPLILLFGDDFGPRMGSVLSGALTMVFVFRFAERHFGKVAAQWSVIALAASFLFVAPNRLLLADPPMVATLSAAIFSFINGISGEKRWFWLAGLALGLALLAKGVMVVVIFSLIALWGFWKPDFPRSDRFKSYGVALAAALVTASTWYVPCYLREPKIFVSEFIIRQHVQRLLGGDEAHRVPPYLFLPYYVIVLAIGTAPWWWFAVKRMRSKEQKSPAEQAMLVWFWTVFILFTISGSKLPHYILPAVVPLAVLAGIQIAKTKPNSPRWISAGLAGAITMSILVNAGLLAYQKSQRIDQSRELAKIARESGLPIANYQLRPLKRDVSIKPRMQETALPSLNLYYGKVPLEWTEFSQLEGAQEEMLVFTRADRISSAEIERLLAAGKSLELVKGGDRYELYRLKP